MTTHDAVLSEIRTSLKYIEKRLEQDAEFKEETRKRQSSIETSVALQNLSLNEISKKLDGFYLERKDCRISCDGSLDEMKEITQRHQILIQKNAAFVKWTAALFAILIPGIIALAQVLLGTNSVSVSPQSQPPYSHKP